MNRRDAGICKDYFDVGTMNPITMVPMMPIEITSNIIENDLVKNTHEIAIMTHMVPIACSLVRLVIPLFD